MTHREYKYHNRSKTFQDTRKLWHKETYISRYRKRLLLHWSFIMNMWKYYSISSRHIDSTGREIFS
jgi:hypothetical protein